MSLITVAANSNSRRLTVYYFNQTGDIQLLISFVLPVPAYLRAWLPGSRLSIRLSHYSLHDVRRCTNDVEKWNSRLAVGLYHVVCHTDHREIWGHATPLSKAPSPGLPRHCYLIIHQEEDKRSARQRTSSSGGRRDRHPNTNC